MKKLSIKLKDVIYLSVILVLIIATTVLSVLLALSSDKGATKDYYSIKCEAFGVQNSNLAKGQIIFIGDSITDMYSLDDHYADLSLAAYNRGIGGDTTDGVLNRLQVSIFDLKPSSVVLMIGTNDVNAGLSEEKILSNYSEILGKITAELPETEIYCISIIPQNEKLEEYTTINVADTTETIKRLNPQIEALASLHGATYVDLFPLIADENDRLIREYSDDGLHLNAEGYKIWTAQLKPYLG